MYIGMVAPHYPYLQRGAEGFVREISKRLEERGHSVSFINIKKDEIRIDRGIGKKWRDICDKTQASGFFRKFIGIEPDIAHFSYFLNRSNSFRDEKYDFLWNNGGEMFGTMLCFKMRKRYGIPFVCTFHGNESMMMVTEGMLKPDLFAVLSQKYLEFIENKVSGNIRCIPNGVDLERFNPKHRRDLGYSIPKPWYISTSAHEHNKHVEQAVDYVAEREGSLVVTSRGSMTDELRERCKKKLKGRHMFLGLVDADEIPVLLASSDYYITCSTSEGHSLAILEALASGLEVIAPNADENIRWTIGSNDRKQAERFSWEKTVDSYLDEMEAIL